MAGSDAYAGNGASPHHAGLKLADLGKGCIDAILDGADLGCDFESGILDHLFAHDCSFPNARMRWVAGGETKKPAWA